MLWMASISTTFVDLFGKIFICILSDFCQCVSPISDDALVFCLVIMGGSIASFFINTGNTIKVIKKEWSIEVPGGYGALIVLLSFFIVKYYFGYLKSTDPELLLKYSIIEAVISGLFSGYFIGRALRYTYKYLKVEK